MKARELLESKPADLPHTAREALPPSMVVPDLGPFYEFYRFVVALAGFPESDVPLSSVFKDMPFIVPYSQQEYDAVTKMLTKMGKHPTLFTKQPSVEHPSTQKASPVRQFKDFSL